MTFSQKRNASVGARLCLAALLVMGCSKNDPSKPVVTFTEKTAPADALFQWMKPSESGVDFSNNLTETHLMFALSGGHLELAAAKFGLENTDGL